MIPQAHTVHLLVVVNSSSTLCTALATTRMRDARTGEMLGMRSEDEVKKVLYRAAKPLVDPGQFSSELLRAGNLYELSDLVRMGDFDQFSSRAAVFLSDISQWAVAASFEKQRDALTRQRAILNGTATSERAKAKKSIKDAQAQTSINAQEAQFEVDERLSTTALWTALAQVWSGSVYSADQIYLPKKESVGYNAGLDGEAYTSGGVSAGAVIPTSLFDDGTTSSLRLQGFSKLTSQNISTVRVWLQVGGNGPDISGVNPGPGPGGKIAGSSGESNVPSPPLPITPVLEPAPPGAYTPPMALVQDKFNQQLTLEKLSSRIETMDLTGLENKGGINAAKWDTPAAGKEIFTSETMAATGVNPAKGTIVLPSPVNGANKVEVSPPKDSALTDAAKATVEAKAPATQTQGTTSPPPIALLPNKVSLDASGAMLVEFASLSSLTSLKINETTKILLHISTPAGDDAGSFKNGSIVLQRVAIKPAKAQGGDAKAASTDYKVTTATKSITRKAGDGTGAISCMLSFSKIDPDLVYTLTIGGADLVSPNPLSLSPAVVTLSEIGTYTVAFPAVDPTSQKPIGAKKYPLSLVFQNLDKAVPVSIKLESAYADAAKNPGQPPAPFSMELPVLEAPGVVAQTPPTAGGTPGK